MTDIYCRRCGEKLGWERPGASGVTIRCVSCGTKNWVGRLPVDPAPLDKRERLVQI